MSKLKTVVERKKDIIARLEQESHSKLFGKYNKVFVSGQIDSNLEYNYESDHKCFYQTRIIVTRLSGVADFIPIIVPENVIKEKDLKRSIKGKWVEVAGELRSRRYTGTDGLRHLQIFLFVHLINIYENEKSLKEESNLNLIYFNGYICKPPVYRKTPSGIEITELLIAVNRKYGKYGKSDYIPCITWDSDARWASKLLVDDYIQLFGRFESRRYLKKYYLDSDEGEYKETYEVSVSIIQKAKHLR